MQRAHFFERRHRWRLKWRHVWSIYWPPNGQWIKCVPSALNPCLHSHVRRLDVNGWIKLRWKCNVEVKIECVMWNEQINGLTTNYSLAPLFKQKQMQTLEAQEIESSSKIDLKDVLCQMSIKDAYTFRALVSFKFSKEGCISLVIGGRPSCVTCKHDWSDCDPL